MRSISIALLGLTLALFATLHVCAQAPRKKPPPPDESKIAEVKKLVGEIYRDEYAKAKSVELKLALVDKLLNDARQSADLSERYSLLSIARDVATSAGDWEASIAAIEQIGGAFDVDTFALADAARAKIEAADKPPRNPKNAFLLLVALSESAISKDRYDIADRLAASAQRVARKANEPQLSKALTDRVAEIQVLKRQFGELQPHLTTLQRDPADPAANLAVGRFRCFVQNRWDTGVAFLALGSDQQLASAAQQELIEPQETAPLVALGDAWWSLADARKVEEKALRRHAVDRYLRAQPRTEGLAKRKLEARLGEVEKWHSKDATYTVSGLSGEFDTKFPPLATLLNATDKFHKDGNEFAFHVTGRNAYIVIDLKREVAVSRLHILNRTGEVALRAKGVAVFISNSPQRGEEIWRAPGAADEWNVVLPKLAVGRYLTIVRDPDSTDVLSFHLRKVKVFGPE